jgi:polysaccharide export outer membrane protein
MFGGMDNHFMAETRVIQALPVLSGYTLNEAGFVELPTIGKINLAGKTLFEAEVAVDLAASKLFVEPAVKLFLLNYFVTVLGEVNKPGRYPVYNHRINIFEAMGLANDATDFASREEVKVVRNRDGVNHLYHIDLTDQNILANDAFYLQPNDIVLVKPQRRKKYATRDIQNVYNGLALVISAATLYLLITKD